MRTRGCLRSDKGKRRYKNIGSDTDGMSDDSSFSPQSPLPRTANDGKKKASLLDGRTAVEVTIISMNYPFVKFQLRGRHHRPVQKKMHVASGEAMIGHLAKRFAALIELRGGVISMDDTCQVLEIKKRRLYDVLHVLEGVGLVERSQQDNNRERMIRWVSPPSEERKEQRKKIRELKEEEARLDKWTAKLSNSSTKDNFLLYAMPEDMLAHNHRKGDVDLIVSSPRGSKLQFVTGTSLRITQSLHGESNGSKAFVMEDNGKLQPIDHRIEPTPLLARCCSDFSIQALSTS